MSCLGPYYLPVPPRLWSRVENPCAYTNSDAIQNIPGDYIYLPYFSEPILKSQYEYQLACLKKGNVLQYKNNSSNLTKKQVYAQIAKQMWVNSNTTWATQSDKFSDPNTKSLKRVNYINITTAGVPTDQPITCSLPKPPANTSLPSRSTSSNSKAPVIPPPPPPNQPGGPSMPPPVPPQSIVEPTVVPDGGTLVCNVTENICTGEIINVSGIGQCYLTTASDVPGHPMLLCYNDNLPTVYPKNRLTYPTSGGKWPVGAKFIAAANTTKPVSSSQNPIEIVKPTTLDDENNYNIYIISSNTTDDFFVGDPGIYIIQSFNGENIVLPLEKKNLSFYTFFNTSGKSVNLLSPNEIIYFFNEFYSSPNGTNNLIMNRFQASTITSVLSDKNMSYFADFNVILTGRQNSNVVPEITYIKNNTTANAYVLSENIADYYIIENYLSSGVILLPDQCPNFTILKFFNLYTSPVTVSSSNLIYNSYYQPQGLPTYTLNPYEWYSFQLIKTSSKEVWIMNSNNNQLNEISLNGPYYISNLNDHLNVSQNAVYIIESMTGNIILPNNPPNLSNIKIFNVSTDAINVTTSTTKTLLCNSFFAPMSMNGVTTYQLSSNSAICFEYLNIVNTPAQMQLYQRTETMESNEPFWIFTIS